MREYTVAAWVVLYSTLQYLTVLALYHPGKLKSFSMAMLMAMLCMLL